VAGFQGLKTNSQASRMRTALQGVCVDEGL
jgi:hypothetical protein